MKFLSLFVLIFTNILGSDYFFEYGKKVELEPIPSTRDLNNNDVKYYKTRDGRKIGIKNEIIVKLKKNIKSSDFFKKYNIKSKNIEKLGGQIYLIKLEKSQNIFKLSNKMYQDSDTKFAVPNKVQKYFLR